MSDEPRSEHANSTATPTLATAMSRDAHLRAANPASRTGAQVMCEALISEGVSVIFGIPGGCIMPFYHAMWEYRARLRHVLCRHEQGAGHAADPWSPDEEHQSDDPQ